MTSVSKMERMAHLAGMIDGEGCIHIAKFVKKSTPTPVYTLMLTISNTKREGLVFLRGLVGGLGSITNGRNVIPTNHNDCYSWQLNSKQAATVLELVYPYLVFKREHADIAFAFRATYGHTPFGRIVGKGTETHRVPAEILYQREQYRTALFRLNAHKTKLGRPPKASQPLTTD